MMDLGGAASRDEKNEAVCMKASGATSQGLRGPVKMYRSGMHPSPRFPARWPELKACLPVAGRKCRVNGVSTDCITLTRARLRIIEQKHVLIEGDAAVLLRAQPCSSPGVDQELSISIGVEV